MKQSLTFAVLLASLLAHSQTKGRTLAGRVKGMVTDQNGATVAGATVYTVPQFSTFESLVPPTVKTDANGQFYFNRAFQLGTYKVYARKDADAYPDRSSSFYAEPNVAVTEVDLTEDDPSPTVDVNLGEKAAMLMGRITDASTGVAVAAKLFFIDEDWNSSNTDSLFANGRYSALLPSDKHLTVLVKAPGYQYFITSLRFQPGEEMQMDISISKE